MNNDIFGIEKGLLQHTTYSRCTHSGITLLTHTKLTKFPRALLLVIGAKLMEVRVVGKDRHTVPKAPILDPRRCGRPNSQASTESSMLLHKSNSTCVTTHPRVANTNNFSTQQGHREVGIPGPSPTSISHSPTSEVGVVVSPISNIPGPSLISTISQDMAIDGVAPSGVSYGKSSNTSAIITSPTVHGASPSAAVSKAQGPRAVEPIFSPSTATSSMHATTAISGRPTTSSHSLENQLRQFVSQKLATLGDLDQAGICALEALTKLVPNPTVAAATPVAGGSAPKVRAPPPGVEEVPKFSGEDPTALMNVLKRYSGCVRAALRRPGIIPEQVNRALIRDVVFVLEGQALEFYNLMMEGKVAWRPDLPSAMPGTPTSLLKPAGTDRKVPFKWREICEALHDKFLPLEGISRTCGALLSLRQGVGESITTYADRQLSLNQRLQWLVDSHGGITIWEAFQIGLFERGLPADLLHAQRAESACTTFQECVSRAERNEGVLSAGRKIVEAKPGPANGNERERDAASECRIRPVVEEAPVKEPRTVASAGEDIPQRQPTAGTSLSREESGKQVKVKTELTASREIEDNKMHRVKNESTTAKPLETEDWQDTTQSLQRNRSVSEPSLDRDDDVSTRSKSVGNGQVEQVSAQSSFTNTVGDVSLPLVSNKRRRTTVYREQRGPSPLSRRSRRSTHDEDNKPPCTVPGCIRPLTHATLGCFHHPENGPRNKKRYDERRRATLARKAREMENGHVRSNFIIGPENVQ